MHTRSKKFSSRKGKKKSLYHLLNSNFQCLKHLVLDISCHMIRWEWIIVPNLPVTEVYEDLSKVVIYSGWLLIVVKISVALGFWRAGPSLYLHITAAASIQDLVDKRYFRDASLRFGCSSALLSARDASRWCHWSSNQLKRSCGTVSLSR